MVLDAARRHLFIVNHEDNSVIVVDENTLAQIARIPVRYHPLGVGMVNDKVYVANNGSTSDPTTVSVISAASLTKIKDIPTQSCGGYAMHVATNPNTGLVYVTLYGNARVAVIDSNTDTIIACVTVETNPFGIAVHVPSNTIYVGNRAGLDLWKINGTTNQAERLFRYSDGRGGGAPYHGVCEPGDDQVVRDGGLAELGQSEQAVRV